ncbi:MAG: hypothetical protein SCM11_00135 [Bacillota bacterium]|nr:hypothetical protein [Bacillota bacterium]
MSNTGNIGNSANADSGKSGGTNRRKRNYRHFGPAGASGDQVNKPAQQANVRTGPVEQRQENQSVHREPVNRETGVRSAEAGAKSNPNQQKTAASGNRSNTRSNKNRRNRSSQNRPQSRNQSDATVAAARAPERAETAPVEKTAQHVNRQSQPPREKPVRADQQMRQNRKTAGSDRSSRWDRRIQAEETYEDIRKDIDRIEKEIWLEIAGLHTIKLDY